MQGTHNGHRVPSPALQWAGSLPHLAADVVRDADLTQPHFHFRVPATPAKLAILRACVRDWTQDIGLTAERSDDVVLVVDEAIANAVEHAYADDQTGAVVVFAAQDRDASVVRVVVSDDGTWRRPAADPGFRGRGLSLMRALSDVFNLHHDSRGTTVVLGWALPS
ncbi:ATP-binding protein [Actinosynnema sp. ALI-1.44]|uniref:ATP-binding protein n=1 Tax=Actinosynnema sp. ALI-1.44 TaxID=1933779 RepID=UPI001EDAD2C2|nr:ATP-binding protein [Actinosynnema sp. ALI-1.44]